MDFLKKQNIRLKVLLTEEEIWVDEAGSSEDEVEGKNISFMDTIDASFTEESSSNTSTFDIGLEQTAKEYNAQNWDSSSVYQVHKFVNNFENEKP